jgi:hypothetical protein
MTRALASAVVLLLLSMGATAWAGKPQIAILGLEIDVNSGVDPETTKVAKDLTAALRERTKAGAGPYAPSTSGDKELIDEKLLKNCDSEAKDCMAEIGRDLNAEVLMYGKLEKSGNTYKVSIKLLNVPKKQLLNSIVETIPVGQASGVSATTHARAWYGKLIGVSTGGTLVVKANIDRGTVILDEDVRGNLSSGAVTIANVSEGAHTLAIEAKDYQRYETHITMHEGETVSHGATLVELTKRSNAPGTTPDPRISTEGTVDHPSGTNIWKPVAITAGVLEAGSIAFLAYSYVKEQSYASKDKLMVTGLGRDVTDSDCGKIHDGSEVNGQTVHLNDSNFKNACDYSKYEKYGWIATSVFGVALAGSIVMLVIKHNNGDEKQPVAAGRRKHRELAITPVVTPDGGGATLRFDW